MERLPHIYYRMLAAKCAFFLPEGGHYPDLEAKRGPPVFANSVKS